MSRKIPPLTNTQCRTAKHSKGGKNRLFDGGGLYLDLLSSGSKRWRMKYRRPVTRKENTLTFGAYPEITLAAARALREAARVQIQSGEDPAENKASYSQDPRPTFQDVCESWLETRQPVWSTGYYQRITNALKANAYPSLGQRPLESITGGQVLDVVRTVENRGALEMASRVLESIGMVFKFGCGTGVCTADVTQGLRQFLRDRPPVAHFPHVSEDDLPQLLRSIEQYHGRPETRYAIKLMMRTFPRTNELRWAEWIEFDLDEGVWLIPGHRMKARLAQKEVASPHFVPLSSQAVEILKQLQRHTGHFRFLFPNVHNPRSSVISSDTMNKALKIMGYGGLQTGHGFRGLASTIMNEVGHFRAEVIESQLAHKERNKIRRAYNHAQYIEERKQLMQWWSDHLDGLLKKP